MSLSLLENKLIPPVHLKLQLPSAYWWLLMMAHHATLNERLFAGRLEPVNFFQDESGELAYYQAGEICFNVARFEAICASDDIQAQEQFAVDILLHEMIHQHIDCLGMGDHDACDTLHNNPYFVAEVNRIAPILGLDVWAAVIPHRQITPLGALDAAQLGMFPIGCRGPGFYGEIEVSKTW